MRKTLQSSYHGILWCDKRLADLDFADDIALLGKDLSDIQRLTEKLIEEAAKVGLRISAEKSKLMIVGSKQNWGHVMANGSTALPILGPALTL